MNRTTITKLTSLVTAGLLGFGLTACSGGGMAADDAPAPTAAQDEVTDNTEQSDNTEQNEPTEETATDEGAAWSVKVDGQAISIDGAEVVCQDAGGMMNIAIASPNDPDQAFAVQLTSGDEPTVKAVGLLDKEGNALAYAEGSGVGKASATKDGNTYEVTGEGMVTDVNNPSSMETKPFEVKVDCS
ncbi:lipoprotein LpqH [Enemella sp. A6]|uniref:lipoprotein LpqH n=1 Tax=Enemella sp. A6 TaxID=3440152 RepID=UPI003EB78E63